LFSFLRIFLPALVAMLLGLTLLFPEIFFGSGRAPIDFPIADSKSEAEGKGMVNITYSGIDKQGRPFSINAEKVDSAPATADVLLLTRPRAQVSLKEGGRLAIAAESGAYDRTRESVDLQEQVTLRQGADLLISTRRARVDLRTGETFGDQAVDGNASFGALTGHGFRIIDNGNRIFLDGPAQLVVQPGAKPRPQ
jgi:lipopolysaccharide export system protein LptC